MTHTRRRGFLRSEVTVDFMDMTNDRQLWARASDARMGLELAVGCHVVVGDEDADPKVVGSNPAPATNREGPESQRIPGLCRSVAAGAQGVSRPACQTRVKRPWLRGASDLEGELGVLEVGGHFVEVDVGHHGVRDVNQTCSRPVP